MNPQHLDHAVRTGLISAALIGTSIGILYGLTHSVQIGMALTDAIGIYADSSGVTFNTGSPLIASMVSIIPAVIGGVAGAGAPIGALTLARWLQLGPAVQRAGHRYRGRRRCRGHNHRHCPSVRRPRGRLGAGVGTVVGIVSFSSYQLQTDIWNDA